MKNLIKIVFAMMMVFTLVACSSPITKKDKKDLAKPIDCSTAQDDIKVLESEKARTGEMIEQGITSILPIGAVISIIDLQEVDKLEVGTGIYNHKITEKIAQIKKECNLQ